MRSYQKEGSFQVFCIQVTPEALCRDTESEMEISIVSDVTHKPSSTSPKRRQPPVATATTSADPVLDQFQQMRLMISTFLGAPQDPTPSPRQLFCNYLHSEIEHLEESDFLTFRNGTVKLLSEIQYIRPKNARDRSLQVMRSPHINIQKHHSPQQDGNTYSPSRKLNHSPFQLCSLNILPQDSLLQ